MCAVENDGGSRCHCRGLLGVQDTAHSASMQAQGMYGARRATQNPAGRNRELPCVAHGTPIVPTRQRASEGGRHWCKWIAALAMHGSFLRYFAQTMNKLRRFIILSGEVKEAEWRTFL